MEGKTNHGELWDACLSSEAPAVAAEGHIGGAGVRWMPKAKAGGNAGAREAAGWAIPDLPVVSLLLLLL